jgi:hypothetical protein
MSGDHNQYQKPTSKDSLQVEAMKQALEALEEIHHGNMTPMAETNWNKAITSLRQAIEQAEKQEPIGWIYEDELPSGYPYDAMFPYSKVDFVRMFPVYAPPEREWVGLTDSEITELFCNYDGSQFLMLIRAIEAKLKEKNAYGWQSVSNPTEYLDELRGGEDT